MDCEWSEWEIGTCSSTSGLCIRTKTRTKKLPESDGGKCEGEITEQEDCNTHECKGELKFIVH